jgi:hypothetical protein
VSRSALVSLIIIQSNLYLTPLSLSGRETLSRNCNTVVLNL